MLSDSFWRAVCIMRYDTTEPTTVLRPPPKRSFSFHCAECCVGIDADRPIFMRVGRSYCSERCRALAHEVDENRSQLLEFETKVRRRLQPS